MTQTILTFITQVKADQITPLSKLLDQINADPETNALVPFRSVKLLHFASLVLHQSDDYGAYLVFENNFDGPLDPYLNELYSHAASGLHQIYSCCRDYSVATSSDQKGLLAYLKKYVVLPSAYHIGNLGRSAARILQEKKLREALETYADRLMKDEQKRSPEELQMALREFVRSNPDFSWVSEFGPRQTFAERFAAYAKLAGTVLVLLIFLPVEIVLLLVLRFKESKDPVQVGAAHMDKVSSLVAREDHTLSVQNHMASITVVKEGWLRRLALRVVLLSINKLARAVATHGSLSGIPSIHFAHWSLIDGGRRLLFLSNFDGSWENYLDDFIDKAAHGLTAIWSNTLLFPRTQFLIFGGARDGPRFKAVARNSQTYTNAWYSAYIDLTVQGIDNSSGIREECFSSSDAKAWLKRL